MHQDAARKFNARPRRFNDRRQPFASRLAAATLHAVIDATVALVYRVDEAELHQPSRGVASLAQARQIAMYLAHVSFGMRITDVSLFFERDRTTVRHACLLIERRREAPRFDLTIIQLEEIIQRLSGLMTPAHYVTN